MSGVLGVVDRDLDSLTGTTLTSENLVYGDCNDLESMLIKSDAFENVIRELGSSDKIRALEEASGCPLRQVLLQAALTVGHLRWISLESNLNLRFRELDFSRFIDLATLRIDKAKLVKTVKDHSQRPDINAAELEAALNRRTSADRDPWEVCNGHDLVQVMSLGLRRAFGSQNAIRVTSDILGQDLRLAYERKDFEQSEFYMRIRAWEVKNHPYKILA